MTGVVLRTFQLRSRIAQLEADGVLLGDWDWVSPGLRDGYRAMIAAMARLGVDTQGLPPIWSWYGDLRLFDATSLLDPQHQLSAGYATVEFEAPHGLVVASDYGAWNDHLAALLTGGPTESTVVCAPMSVARRPDRRSWAQSPEQVCLPYLRHEWVREIRLLPTSGWDAMDLSQPA